jgi:hypothetical protein
MGDWSTELTRRVRLYVYRTFVETGRAPTPPDLAQAFELMRGET